MAIRNILTEEDPVLRKVSKPVVKFDESLHQLLDDMHQTLTKAQGAGLAAVQVGVLKRAVLVEVNGLSLELINPVITEMSGSQCGDEGCLSIPRLWRKVTRPNHVRVEAFDRFGNPYVIEGNGYLARALCHECDHLEGILFVDKADKK